MLLARLQIREQVVWTRSWIHLKAEITGKIKAFDSPYKDGQASDLAKQPQPLENEVYVAPCVAFSPNKHYNDGSEEKNMEQDLPDNHLNKCNDQTKALDRSSDDDTRYKGTATAARCALALIAFYAAVHLLCRVIKRN